MRSRVGAGSWCPKRLRWYLEREPWALSAVPHIFLRVIERQLRQTSPGASPGARFGAVSVVHRFGAALNRHVHFHCCVLDGVFEGGPTVRSSSDPPNP
ncbi:transposase [uncultured Lamprocystis sp.]|uniref:transposase n=1 Tax=uncultured Lamprocystis sp. TaxID=543132 RepID=UPI0025DCE3F2|nr:transposase [uncultured Lamprocystis sp.]